MVQCHRFYNLVLLPKIREDIAEHKKLNFHYYQALKKALFKPSAFMKGILLPLCQVPLSTSNIFKFLVLIVLQSYSCTLREAAILSSIIMKKSIPVLHSSAALLKIAELDYHPANVFFMKWAILVFNCMDWHLQGLSLIRNTLCHFAYWMLLSNIFSGVYTTHWCLSDGIKLCLCLHRGQQALLCSPCLILFFLDIKLIFRQTKRKLSRFG